MTDESDEISAKDYRRWDSEGMGRTPEENYHASDYRTRGTGSNRLPLGTIDAPPIITTTRKDEVGQVRGGRAALAGHINRLGLQAYMKKCRRGEKWDSTTE